MFFLLGWKDFKRTKRINLLVIMLLVVVFLTAISIVSAVEEKFKKYAMLSEYFNKNGVYIESLFLSRENDDYENNNVILTDEKAIKEYLPDVDDVLSVEEVWLPFVIEAKVSVSLWCYSGAVTDMLSPDMESGRWFQESDMNSGVLKAVVTHNEGILKVGDIVTVATDMSGVKQQVEIIGVIKDNESLFYSNIYGTNFGDYRDCYYTYNYEAEEHRVLMIVSDKQILNGEEREEFGSLNSRLGAKLRLDFCFQKEMKGPTILTYGDDIPQEVVDRDIEKLNKYSFINRVYNLSKMNENSWDYILEEMHNYLPVFICVFVFVIIAAVSANAITVKKQLKNYAIYYICGLPWKNCARISLSVACITSGIAFGMVVFSIYFLKLTGMIADIALKLGPWQLITCAIIMVCYVILAWSIPLGIVRNTSAKEIMTNNH